MTSIQLMRAGRLSIANAVITIPLFLFSLLLSMQSGYGARVIQTMLMLVSTLMLVYVLLVFLGYLNDRHSFHATDFIIKAQIWINLAATVVNMLGLLGGSLEELSGVLALVLVVPAGAVQAVFGFRLLRLPDSLNGRLKPFCYLMMATGISFMLIVPIPLGLLTSAAADIILATVLLEAARNSG